MTSSEHYEGYWVIADAHNVSIVTLFHIAAFRINLRPVLVSWNTNHIVSSIFFLLFETVITPNTDTFIPTNCNEVHILLFFRHRLTWSCKRLEYTAKSSDFCVNYVTPSNGAPDCMLSLNRLQALAVREIPNLTVSSFRCSDQPTWSRIKASSSDLGLELISSLILWHQLSVFNIPYCDVTAIICTHDRLKLCVKQCECNWELVRSFDFFLSLEKPEVYLSRSEYNVVSPFVKVKTVENIVRSVAEFICYSLDQEIVVQMPDLDNLVSSERNEMISILVQSEILYSSSVTR